LIDQLHIPKKLLSDYCSLGMNETELVVVLQVIRYLSESNDFPTPKEIAKHMTFDEKECANILGKLIQKDLLAIFQIENEKNQLTEVYSIDPLLEKLYIIDEQKEEEEGAG